MATNAADRQAFGKEGFYFESGTTAVTGTFCAIACVEDTVFSAITMPKASGDALTGVTFPAGFTIYGDCTAFTLTSGKVIAYEAVL